MKKDLRNEKSNLSKASVITLIVFVAVLGVMMSVFCILYALEKTDNGNKSVALENIYQRSFFDLVENVNNTETKMAKLLNSTNENLSRKLLSEIHENTNSAQNNLSYLPISINGIPETTKFINQLSAYANTLSKSEDATLSTAERKTLVDLHNAVSDIKYKLNEMSTEIMKGYNITSHSSLGTKKDYTKFTGKLQKIKSTDVDYPTMIYDGPFSDSVMNKEIKGLPENEVSKEKAQEIAENLLKNTQKVEFFNETNGKFKTFDFKIVLTDGSQYFAQITKLGGKLLTLSSFSNNNENKISIKEAIKIAEDFALAQGLKNMECVWSDFAQGDVYLNLAPVKDEIVLYPDLIKVKVDLGTGNILGWEASSYYTNHIKRYLNNPTISKAEAEKQIKSGFEILESRLTLSPIEYKEILTYEVKCTKESGTYYFYFNAYDGTLENILKVIETDNGNLLM